MLRKGLFIFTILLSLIGFNQAIAQNSSVERGFSPAVPVPTLNLPTSTSFANTGVTTPTTPLSPTGSATSLATETDPVSLSIQNSANPSDRTITSVETPAIKPQERAYLAGQRLEGVGKAFDGHSLTVGNHPVRLNGIEAPGRKQLCATSSGTSWKCGEKSYERLLELVDGKNVVCTVDSPAGSGAAATCSASRVKDIGRLLAAEGLAITNKHSKGKYQQELRSARSFRKGIWTGSFEDPAKWRIKNK